MKILIIFALIISNCYANNIHFKNPRHKCSVTSKAITDDPLMSGNFNFMKRTCTCCGVEKDLVRFSLMRKPNGKEYYLHKCLDCKAERERLYRIKVANKKIVPIENLPGEIWKSIKGLEGLYSISSEARIKRDLRVENKTQSNGVVSRYVFPEKILATAADKNGYRIICIGSLNKRIHRLVAEAFIENPDNKPQINHINGVKDDNRPENLEWVTCQENINHAERTGLRTHPKGIVSKSKLTEEQVIEIRNSNLMIKELVVLYGVGRGAISKAKNGKTWQYLNKKDE